MKLVLKITILLLTFSYWASAQYLHRNGKYIVDGNDNEFIIRSMGLGGWMLQEGYMLGTAGFAGTQHEIRALMEESMGKDRTDEFYEGWLANHCTKTDIDSLASWGFNAVRPALHYNLFTLPIEEEPVAGEDTWLETGFQMVDELIEWCEANEMYVILDLHAAPGGQGKNADISDYDPSKPSLWESEENQRKTIALWKKLAERYADEKYIGGYDLINETNWNFNGTNENGCDSSNEKLRELMIQITDAVREVDSNHLIFIEGNCWANNMTSMFPVWDDNMAYSFHKYWNGTDRGTINEFLEYRDQYNVPIWLGESGENSNQWFYKTIQMLESQKIGWSWWPLKKLGSVVAPLNALRTPEYDQLIELWSNGQTPESDFCYQSLMKMTENLMIENCEYHPDVIDAMFRQQIEGTSIPYSRHEIPGVITAVDFDMGRHDVAYHDQDYINTSGNAGGTSWNNGWTYRNDGVDIQPCKDHSSFSNGYNVGWTNAGEWMVYTVNVRQAGAYNVTFRVAGTSGIGKFHLEVNNKNITGAVSAPATESDQDWTDVTVENVILEEGLQKIKFHVDRKGFNLNYIRFSDPKAIGKVPTKVLNGYSNSTGASIYLAINKPMDQSVAPVVSDFRLKVNGLIEQFSEISYNEEDHAQLVMSLKKKTRKDDEVYLSYVPGNIIATDEQALQAFSNLKINTAGIDVHEIPGKIEAEDFEINSGWVIEDCLDEGEGFDMGHTNPGDYLDYKVDVVENGLYEVSYRVASGNSNGGKIDLVLINGDGETKLQTLGVPLTDGWQNWITVTRQVNLPEGEYIVRVYVNQQEFNLNWIGFELLEVTGIDDQFLSPSNFFQLYPNPVRDKLFVNFSKVEPTSFELKITNLQGEVLKVDRVRQKSQVALNLEGLNNGMYILQVANGEQVACQQFIVMK